MSSSALSGINDILLSLQAELPEEDMDVRGGGGAADQERITKDDGYGSDNEVDSRNDAIWNANRQNSATSPVNRSIAALAAMHAQDEDSSEAAQPSGTTREPSAEPLNTGGQIAPPGGIAGMLTRDSYYLRTVLWFGFSTNHHYCLQASSEKAPCRVIKSETSLLAS